MHKLLERQLRRYFPAGQVPPELEPPTGSRTTTGGCSNGRST